MEVPEGYRLVRIGQRGRVPKLTDVAEEQLTVNQKKNLKYRLENAEKRKQYARDYYAKNREKILKNLKANYYEKRRLKK